MCRTRLSVPLILLVSTMAEGAQLRINWQGLAGEQTIELAVGEQAVVEVWVDLNSGDTLSGLFFHNEDLATVSQVSCEAVPAGWNANGLDGVLGPASQEASFFAEQASGVITETPGSFLIGRQTLVLDGGVVGEQQEITISLSNADLSSESGASYTLVASDSASAEDPGFYHIGVGSPGYQLPGAADVRDPLIIEVVSGGSPPPPNDNTNDNLNTNDNVNDNTNDNTNTNDNVNDNINDNTNTNDNVNDNTNTNDNVNDNISDNTNINDNTNTNDNVNDNTNSNANDNSSAPPSTGFCGMGAVSMMPLCFAGLFLMQVRRRRRHK